MCASYLGLHHSWIGMFFWVGTILDSTILFAGCEDVCGFCCSLSMLSLDIAVDWHAAFLPGTWKHVHQNGWSHDWLIDFLVDKFPFFLLDWLITWWTWSLFINWSPICSIFWSIQWQWITTSNLKVKIWHKHFDS